MNFFPCQNLSRKHYSLQESSNEFFSLQESFKETVFLARIFQGNSIPCKNLTRKFICRFDFIKRNSKITFLVYSREPNNSCIGRDFANTIERAELTHQNPSLLIELETWGFLSGLAIYIFYHVIIWL